uniref:ABC transmembrane type-1 domain-containing protein n=1 Tax=Photinus pyralis TaxID=7054 RepID=A0A1Y1MHV4_PHOPY
MSEITAGIQVIKMYAWEKPFEEMVKVARKLEMDVMARTSYIRGFLISLTVFSDRFSLFLTIVTYVLLGNALTSDKVFSMAQLFNTVQSYMVVLYPFAMSFFAEAKVSVERVEVQVRRKNLMLHTIF